MPIRTRRGRAGAYHALWTWPLRSPARLGGVLAAATALVVGVSVAAGGDAGGPSAVATGPPTVGEPRMAALPGAVGSAPELRPQRLPLASVPPAALTAAAAWATAWATHPAGTSGAAWSEGLRPWTTEEYLPVLASVDPANVPGTRVTGPAVAVEVRPDAVRVQVPTDAVRLELLLVQTAPGRWRVSSYGQVG